MIYETDILIFGAGVAGLWLGNRLKRAGYDVVIIEKETIGAGQTLASQGMIHGGQKYALTGNVTAHAKQSAEMPARWDACLEGYGEIDLTAVKVLNGDQVMWPAGSVVSEAAVFGAAKIVNAATEKMKADDWPEALKAKKKFKGPVYRLPEKVLDAKSLLLALLKNLKGHILHGTVTEIMPDGQAAVSGHVFRAQLIIFAAGAGNEEAFRLLNIETPHTQRRPLRQIMVRTMEYPLFGHGIVSAPKPRVTVTSQAVEPDGFVWYLGGNIAERAAVMDESAAICFAQEEMKEIFPGVDWAGKEWATHPVDRAEPFSAAGDLPAGPFLHQRGKIIVAWPAKMTFVPALADHVFDWLATKDIAPHVKNSVLPPLSSANLGSYPWETAVWRKSAP